MRFTHIHFYSKQVYSLTSLEFLMEKLNEEIIKKGLLTQQEVILMHMQDMLLNINMKTTFFKNEPLSR